MVSVKKKKQLNPAILCWLTLFILIGPALVLSDESFTQSHEEHTSAQDLITWKTELQRTFLDGLRARAAKVRAALDAAQDEQGKKAVIEEFRLESLKKIQEFKAEEEALAKEIEDISFKT